MTGLGGTWAEKMLIVVSSLYLVLLEEYSSKITGCSQGHILSNGIIPSPSPLSSEYAGPEVEHPALDPACLSFKICCKVYLLTPFLEQCPLPMAGCSRWLGEELWVCRGRLCGLTEWIIVELINEGWKTHEYNVFSSLTVSKMSAVRDLLAGIFLKCLQVRGKKRGFWKNHLWCINPAFDVKCKNEIYHLQLRDA